MKTIRIGNAGGYWGDDPDALKYQVTGGDLDFITIDYLAEITMSIMNKQLRKNPEAGYAKDFLGHLEPVFETVMEKGIRIITNAGGVNPLALARALGKMAAEKGLKPKIAVVDGDNILDDIDHLSDEGVDFSNMENGAPYSEIRGRVLSANLYFGARPVVRALKAGADIVITGRVTDTGITLAAMMASFDWAEDDYDKLATGIVAGHILECGAQSTGGNFTDWRKVPSFDVVGYPIAEISEDGGVVITKHEGLGGLVSVDTVREQLLYEMGEPKNYITPDVIADFSSIQLEAAGENRVRVFGIKGAVPTDLLKVSVAYEDGFKSEGTIIISGPDAREKAEKFAEIFWSRVGTDFEDHLTEYVGLNACHRHLAPLKESNEVLLRFAVRDHDRSKFERFRRKLPALILSGPPAVAVTGGAPQVRNVVSYWPALVPQDISTWEVTVFDGDDVLFHETGGWPKTGGMPVPAAIGESGGTVPFSTETKRVPLKAIALGRSGDKGDMSNIGVIARSELAYHFIGTVLTAERVKEIFRGLVKGKVERYPVSNLLAWNFLLHEALGGGGTLGLRIDAQGKTLAHALIAQEFDIPVDVLASVES
ncbi:MAG: DUF1446 domain-containing protein [Acidobacteria bacterium]|nr:MAG: DUF1446 domain-containing protein [Acidobacteriota bacterium]